MKIDKYHPMKEYIRNWGLPECLRDISSELIYKFDSHGILNTYEESYYVDDRNFKFCLYEPSTGLALLSMEFFKTPLGYSCSKPFIVLELLYVHQEFWRKKGIASFYIRKLIQYAIEEKMDHIQVTPMADADNFKDGSDINALTQDELIEFYMKWHTPEMPFHIIIPEEYE
jgi:GNAT superfamily N-acetyltransferase